MKTTRFFDSFEAYSEFYEGRETEYNRVDIVGGENWVCADALIECKRLSTALRRFEEGATVDARFEWIARYYADARTLDEVDNRFYPACDGYMVEQIDDGVFYVAARVYVGPARNVETTAEETEAETPEEPAEVAPVYTLADYTRDTADLPADELRATLDNLRDALATLEHIQSGHVLTGGTPAETVAEYVAALDASGWVQESGCDGCEIASAIIASLVNRSAWDGRLSRSSVDWARTVEHLDEDLCNRIGIYNRIHMTHLDQIARAMMAYEPQETASEEVEQVETVDALGARTGFDVQVDGRHVMSTPDIEQAVSGARRIAASDGVDVMVTAHYTSGQSRSVVFRPDGRTVKLWEQKAVQAARQVCDMSVQTVARKVVQVEDLTAHVETVEDIEQMPERVRKTVDRLYDCLAHYARIPVESLSVCIAAGNSKIGRIPNVSLPPVLSCRGICSECAAHCYDCKAVLQYKTVAAARARNWYILRRDPAKYWEAVRAAARKQARTSLPFFRFHVGGEIPSREYLREMVRTAEEVPEVTFLVFSKRHHLISDEVTALGGRDAMPGNLRIIFSAWPGRPVYNPHHFPMSAPFAEDLPDGWTDCPGNCETCARDRNGCFGLRSGQVVGFHYHGTAGDSFAADFAAWDLPQVVEV